MSDSTESTSTETSAPEANISTAAPSSDTAPPAGDAPKTYDESTVKDLRKESANYRTKLRETETSLTTVQTELAQAREQIPALETRATSAEGQALRYRVALDAGLPRSLADRLVGSDEEALKADAEHLQTLVGQAAPTLDLSQGARTSTAPAKDVNAALRALAGRTSTS